MRHGRKTTVHAAKRDPWSGRGVDLYLVVDDWDTQKCLAPAPLVLENTASTGDVAPLTRLEPEEAQALMDSLWDCGLRPSAGAGSAGAMLAAETNLADLRTIVGRLFGLLEKR